MTPFNIFVPDLREREIDDQPYVIQAQVKPLEWCKNAYAEQLNGKKLEPTQSSSNTFLDDRFFSLTVVLRPPRPHA